MGRLLSTAIDLDRNVTQALQSLKQGSAGIIAEGRFSDINETLQRYSTLQDLLRFKTFMGRDHC